MHTFSYEDFYSRHKATLSEDELHIAILIDYGCFNIVQTSNGQ